MKRIIFPMKRILTEKHVFFISIDFNSCQYSYKALQFVTVSFPSFLRRFFNTLQYVCGFLLSVKTATTSTTEIKHIILRNQ